MMDTALKKLMSNLLIHKNNLNEYVDSLYKEESIKEDLNSLLGALKSEGLITYMYADDIAYNVALTIKGRNLRSNDLRLSDKEELLSLIDRISLIEGLFHTQEGNRNTVEIIYDVSEFQYWLQQVEFYLQKIVDKKFNQYIIETINCGKHLNGSGERIKFNEFTARLRCIERNIDIYYKETDISESIPVNTSRELHMIRKQYDVFISHANRDKLEYVEELYQAISKLGINIFYDRETFEWGDNWKQKIYDGVDTSEFAIIVISQNYFGREWTEKELKSFLNRQNASGEKIILPLLHGITISDLCEHYPELGELQAISDDKYDIKDVAILFARQLLRRYRNG
jgi:hypothetical protein